MGILQRCCERLSRRVLHRRYCYRRQWRHLRQLDDYLLRDIGFDPYQLRRDWRTLQRPCRSRETIPSEAAQVETMPHERPAIRGVA